MFVIFTIIAILASFTAGMHTESEMKARRDHVYCCRAHHRYVKQDYCGAPGDAKDWPEQDRAGVHERRRNWHPYEEPRDPNFVGYQD